MTIAVLPQKTGIESIEAVDGLSPGLMSAGLGRVPAPQSLLDITQGNRVSGSLYDGDLPVLRFNQRGVKAESWQRVLRRAESAPAEIVPGLLATTLTQAGVPVQAKSSSGVAGLIAADRDGRIAAGSGAGWGVVVRHAEPDQLEDLLAELSGDDMLIVFDRPPPAFRTLSIWIAGEGFDGLLTSDSTRTDGLVTATDIAPTVLERYGVEVPDEINGQENRAEGEADVAGLVEMRDRLEVTGARRGPVVGQTLLAWVAVALIAAVALRGRVAKAAVALLALSALYLPLVLLLTPLLDPSLPAERLVAGLGAPLLALITWRLAPGWSGLALACLITVSAYAVDVLAGSILIPLSLPGPNPASGSRFYGIGNEIEAMIGALLPLGVGAALASVPRTRDGGAAAAAWFLAVGLIAAAGFALGRFGADVGAAIVLPTGAAVAAAVALGTRRGVLLAVLIPIGCVVALMAADLVLGGGAHLTRSVLDAGGLEEAGNVFERRIRLAAASFTRGANVPFMVVAGVAIAVGIRHRHRIRSWFGERAAFAGFVGALAAAAIGTVSNDSGVTLLILGTAFAAAGAGFAWTLPRDPETGPAR
ncbi:MAG: hypothetical protein ABI726_02285 [bacterium]